MAVNKCILLLVERHVSLLKLIYTFKLERYHKFSVGYFAKEIRNVFFLIIKCDGDF